jgi:peptide/nickel transport system substrate-binding protein
MDIRKLLVLTAVVIVGGTSFAGCFGSAPPPPVNLPPFASASTSASTAAEGTPVTFSATAADLDGTITTYRWDFGDGSNGTGATASHSYAHQGHYYVTVNVTDNSGGTYDTVQTGVPLQVVVLPVFPLTTANDQPFADLTLWQDTSVIKPNNALSWLALGSKDSWNLSADGSDGHIITYSMDYGEGSPDSHDNASREGTTPTWNGNFSHNYSKAGIFAATLTVTSNTSKADMFTWTVVVVGAAVTPNIKNPKTLVIETIGQPEYLDPAVAYDDASGAVIQAVYETLLTYRGSSKDTFDPLLAETIPTVDNGLITNNNLTYTFPIKHGIKFTSGDTMDANDVVYSIKRLLIINDPGGPAWILSQVLTPDSIRAVDNYTVEFTLTAPYGAFISTLAYTEACIVSKSTVEATGGIVARQKNTWMNTHMDGTGPWMMTSWIPNDRVVLDKNPGYWNATRAAHLDRVVIRTVNEFSNRLLDLRSGAADIIYVPAVNRPDVQAIAAVPAEGVSLSSGDSTWSILTGVFNFNIDISARSLLQGNPGYASPDNIPADFFQDIQMRKAFSLAYDYDDYITNVAKGLAFRLSGIIPRGMYGYEDTLAVPTLDMTAAGAAYNASAWVAAHGYSYGFNISVATNAGNTNRVVALNILKRGVEALGPNIHVNVLELEWSVYLGTTLHTTTEMPGPLGVFFIGWGPDYADPDDYIVPFCKGGATYPQYTGFSNASLDTLINRAASIPNSQERLDLYAQIQRSIVDNDVYLLFTEAKNFHVARSWVTGWYFNPMLSGSDLGGNLAGLDKA